MSVLRREHGNAQVDSTHRVLTRVPRYTVLPQGLETFHQVGR